MSDELNNNSLRVFDRPATLKLLGMSDRTFDRLVAKGEAPPKIQLSTRRVGYRASDLKDWLDQRRQQKTA
jgi:predicted DNA-binding transcriptional regulator AlpA